MSKNTPPADAPDPQDAVAAVEAVETVEALEEVAETLSVDLFKIPSKIVPAPLIPGDRSSFAQIVNEKFGVTSDVYEGASVEAVKAIQAGLGLEPTGIVAETLWAEVLPEVGPGDMGVAVVILQMLLGCSATGFFDFSTEVLAEQKLGVSTVDRDGWLLLLA